MFASLFLLALTGCLQHFPSPDHVVDSDDDGFVDADDCDPDDEDVNPDADEVCDGKDNDCDGQTDEIGAVDGALYFADADLDGYGDPRNAVLACSTPDGYVDNDWDCNDGAPSIHPNVTDGCNGIDDDCDYVEDEDAPGVMWADRDEDDYGDPYDAYCDRQPPSGVDLVDNPYDCDDQDPDSNPDAQEVCDDADNDCDGYFNEDPIDPTTWCQDSDGDDHGDPAVTAEACDAPGDDWVEACDDCDDDLDTIGPATPWYEDGDADTWGKTSTETIACEAPTGTHPWVDRGGDCDDGEEDANPGESEVCQDGLDNDCDPDTDCHFPLIWNLITGTPTDPDITLEGLLAESRAGQRVYVANLDGDAYDDVIATTQGLSSAELGVIFGVEDPPTGTVSFSAAADLWILPDVYGTDAFATSFAALDTGNDDGFRDVAVGDPAADANGSNPLAGAVYVFETGNTGDTGSLLPDYEVRVRLDGPSADAEAGVRVVATPGAYGTDGAFAISAPGASSDDGAVYVVHDLASLQAATKDVTLGEGGVDKTYQGPPDGSRFGTGLAFFHGPGGVRSLAVGATGTPTADGVTASADGALYIFRLPLISSTSPPAATSAAVRLYGVEGSGGAFGAAIANVGDVTGDGVEDLLVGAPAYEGWAAEQGKVYLISGAIPNDTVGRVDTLSAEMLPAYFLGPSASSAVGKRVAGGCDVDGDGSAEILFGSPQFEVSGVPGAGMTWLFYGGPGLSGSYELDSLGTSGYSRLFGTETQGRVGSGLACGDIDGDGFSDIVIGADGVDLVPARDNAGVIGVLMGTGQ